ncbi:MAG: hypothetical protein COT88_01930 [Candidatus Colwellbacteria bacterium CG10_big_fil_rev_8_21_14_0_10_41_28]|uniref:SHS2 domain-containing protein n=1 Tax=Candidatus Colwellbacteria bacterium CG10_big_fil_rev_8_21_14_0_10_41_28 TaxID=1974539 RepID=A0A2H0VGZ7_9BACT|nr:MAG: hypothetical protein COT88_01930 [Candidatus Colwellbacteria bacterium CG10_big_fil_rev_8_21_14_0_10_41_28]
MQLETDKLFKGFSSLTTKVTPKIEVAGLQITDSLIRYTLLKENGEGRDFALRPAPGVIVGGKVANRLELTKILKQVHKKASISKRKPSSIILTVGIDSVFIRPMILPAGSSDALSESANLNLRMQSPIDSNNAYYDWQQIDISARQDEQIEIIGAFVGKNIIEDYLGPIHEAGFNVAAVEFITLSLIRAAVNDKIIEPNRPYVVLDLSPEGINFAISHNSSLYFHYFVGWDVFRDQDKTISTEKFKSGLSNEVRRIVNFYSANVKDQEIRDMLIIGTSFVPEITETVQRSFPGIEIRTSDPNVLNPARGAAIRGLIPRSQDFDISLASLSAIEIFQKDQLANFVSIWRNVVLATMTFIMFLFFSTALVLRGNFVNVGQTSSLNQDVPSPVEIASLEKKANEFNNLVNLVTSIRAQRNELYPLLEALNTLAGDEITITRYRFVASAPDLTLNGTSISEDAAVEFKERLEGQKQFSNVKLPLNNIRTESSGGISFSITFTVDSLDFGE